MYAQRQLAYAPTPYSYTPVSNFNATINLDEEVKLSTTNAERDLHESLAEIYSIIITLDALEKAFLKDSIVEADYTDTCSRLLRQYSSNLADETVAKAFIDLETFKRVWSIECPRATERIRIGIPATVERPTPSSAPQTGNAQATLVIAASEDFITLLDAIKIGMVSKDTLHPLLGNVIQSANKVTSVEFNNKPRIVQWLITLNQMRAAQELSEDQAREFHYDMETAPTLETTAEKLNMADAKEIEAGQKHEQAMHVMNFPQLYQKPALKDLLNALHLLVLEPSSFGQHDVAIQVEPEGVPMYLTSVIASPLTWIEQEDDREGVWALASRALASRCGRTAMGDMTRTFTIPMKPGTIDIVLHEPALTGDNLGLKTWSSALMLANKLQHFELARTLGPELEYPQILELGAGTGLVGLVAAALWQRSVVLTDLEEISRNLEINIQANTATLTEYNTKAFSGTLDWARPEDLILTGLKLPEMHKFKVILAADLIYSADHPQLLVAAILSRLLPSETARLIVSYPTRAAYAPQIEHLRALLESSGLESMKEYSDVGQDDWADDVTILCSIWKWRKVQDDSYPATSSMSFTDVNYLCETPFL